MRIVIGSDHAGYETKEAVKEALSTDGHEVVDVGTRDGETSVDYPDYAKEVAEAVADSDAMGILVCGTGTGMVMAANKVAGVRAAMIYDDYSAEMARVDNDANVACLRGREFPPAEAARLAKKFLSTAFSEGERHKRRIEKLGRMDS